MPEGWVEKTLGDVCQLVKGTSPTLKTNAGEFPLIVTGPIPLSSDSYQFDGEAVCVPMVSSTGHGHASLKRVHYASGKFAVANIITACIVNDPGECDTKFLYLYLQHFKDELIVTRMRGTANVSLSLRALATVPIGLPALPEQKRIVDLLGALDDVIEAADEATESSRLAFSATINKLAAEDHPTAVQTTIGKVTTFAGGYSFPLKLQGQARGQYPFYKVSDMNLSGNESLMSVANNWLDPDGVKLVRGKIHPAGTVVFPKVGAALLTEKRRVLGQDSLFDNNVMGLIPGSEIVSGYLLMLMETILLGDLAQTGAVPSINQGHVSGFPIVLPSLEVQTERLALVSAMRSTGADLSEYAASLRNLRQNFLTMLLSGEYEIPSSYDQLLEVVA